LKTGTIEADHHSSDIVPVLNNTKQFWSYMKSKKQDSQGVTPLRKDDGFLYSDTETKAGILNDHFHSVYTREDMTAMSEKGQSPYPDMPDIHIGGAGVLKAFLASFCTVVFSCLYLTQSFILFVCLALENAFCRLRSKRVMSVVIHVFDGLFLEIFDGTRSAVMITDIAFLKSFHLSFTDVYCPEQIAWAILAVRNIWRPDHPA
jgi:hypothetical protein